jgi:3-oxoacyl-[acyl-carrier-protein] synthase-3
MIRELFAEVVGTGSALPPKVVTNVDLERIVDTSDEWIVTRTGIRERHIADEGEPASKYATLAAERALEDAGVKAEDLDFILVATVTPDTPFPSTSCIIQKELGAPRAACMDISAGCSGFLYGLVTANTMIKTGAYKNVLVVGVELLSKITDWTDRGTCVLLADGAGAAVVRASEKKTGILGTHLGSDGSLGHLLHMPGGGSLNPATHHTIDARYHYLKMQGNEVFKHAVQVMGDISEKLLSVVGLKREEISYLVPHQANLRIIQATARRLRLPMEKVYVNIDRYGNTSSATIPIALDEINRLGLIKPGDKLLMVAFGAGFTWGVAALEWSKQNAHAS